MRGRLTALLILLLLVLPIIKAEVTPEVEAILATQNETEVIIEIYDNGQTHALPGAIQSRRGYGQADYQSEAIEDFKVKHTFPNSNTVAGRLTKKGLELLRNNQNILIRRPVIYRKSMDVSGPAIQSDITNGLVYNGINLTGQGYGVCVVDSGIDYTHENLGKCNLIQFLAGNCNKIPYGWDFVNSDNNPMDDEGHGTHVAGTVASNHSTYRGIAPGVHLIAMKALDNAGDGTEADIAAAIQWCVDNATKYNITVITMSLGTDTLYTGACDHIAPTINTQINRARANNITVTVSTGNDGSTTQISHPACAENATAIGAVNDANAFAYNRNNMTNFVAPGVGIISTALGGGTTSKSGTSMACPHAAASFILLQQYRTIKNLGTSTLQLERNFHHAGLNLSDAGGSNLNYTKFQIYDAIASLTSAPSMTNYTPEPQVEMTENSSQEFTQKTEDTDDDQLTYSWQLNGAEVSTTANYTYITDFDANGTHNLTLYVKEPLHTITQFWNVTVTNVNRPPTFITITNLTINETELGTLVVNATDLDNETVTYYYPSPFNSSGQWKPNNTDAGTYDLTIIASDTENNVTTPVTVTVFNVADYDGDNIRDSIDPDDDNDGILDIYDYILGNATNIQTTVPNLEIYINNSNNLSRNFNNSININITNNNLTITINYTINSTNPLNFAEVQINHTTTANTQYITINSLNTSNLKTIILTNQSNNSNGVCIKDAIINDISQITAACSGSSEILLRCPATSGQYACKVTPHTYIVTGLTHSAVREQCIESWSCDSWSSCSNSQQTRTCTDTFQCGTNYNKPSETQSCSTNNNGGGGGGGGGGSYTTSDDNDTTTETPTVASTTSSRDNTTEHTQETTTPETTQPPETQTTESETTLKPTGFAILKNKEVMTRAGITFAVLLLMTFLYMQFRAPRK